MRSVFLGIGLIVLAPVLTGCGEGSPNSSSQAPNPDAAKKAASEMPKLNTGKTANK